MSSTLIPRATVADATPAPSITDSTAAIPAQRVPHRRRRSRRTTWVVAGGAAVVIAATGGTIAVLSSGDAAAPPAHPTHQGSSARADAEESSHGFGPALGQPLPVARRTEASQLVHGSAGALRDATGRPLPF
jgi:hypothetical protein